MKFCAKCGVQNNDDDAFCYACGTLFEEQNQAQQQQPQQQAWQQPQQQAWQQQPQQQAWQQQPQQQAWQQPQQQPAYQQQSYQQPGMQPPKRSAALGITSMVLGICALLFSCCIPYLPFFLALVAVVLGGVSLAKKMGGKGMAIAGLVCGIIALVPSVIFLISGAAILSAIGISL